MAHLSEGVECLSLALVEEISLVASDEADLCAEVKVELTAADGGRALTDLRGEAIHLSRLKFNARKKVVCDAQQSEGVQRRELTALDITVGGADRHRAFGGYLILR